eukprot:GHVR01106561.1.p1 GENE.GHVR01106561.1~~GHVR01106561.1.p1  ORF type:complete len:204 (+),score=35.78 GHVR01106561.1:444-1055(+)
MVHYLLQWLYTGGLFVTMSRVNHDCIGNSDHYYSARLGVKLLIAKKTINEGEEINFNYCVKLKYKDRINQLNIKFNFKCDCNICEGKSHIDMREDYDRMVQFDDDIYKYVDNDNINMAIKSGKKLISLFDKYDESSVSYHRTYFDLYQCALLHKITLKEAFLFIQKAYEYLKIFIEDDYDDYVKTMKNYAQNPTSHKNYLYYD